jgi:O-antigen ligase
MRSFLRVLRSKANHPQRAVWILCIAWLVGSSALIIGLHGGAGEIPAICMFAIACVLWRFAYKLRGKKRHPGDAIGFLALAIWSVNLLGALAFDFHYYLTDFFFWASTATLLILIAAALKSGLQPRHRRRIKAALRIFAR